VPIIGLVLTCDQNKLAREQTKSAIAQSEIDGKHHNEIIRQLQINADRDDARKQREDEERERRKTPEISLLTMRADTAGTIVALSNLSSEAPLVVYQFKLVIRDQSILNEIRYRESRRIRVRPASHSHLRNVNSVVLGNGRWLDGNRYTLECNTDLTTVAQGFRELHFSVPDPRFHGMTLKGELATSYNLAVHVMPDFQLKASTY